MAWNFKRGYDLNTGIPFPNTAFIDGVDGVDMVGNGGRLNPYKSITFAKTQHAAPYTFILSPFIYSDQFGQIGSFENYSLIGDIDDADVVIEDTLGVLDGAGLSCENIIFKGFFDPRIHNRNIEFPNCIFLNCLSVYLGTSNGCKFINSDAVIDISGFQALANSMFLSNTIRFQHSNPATTITIQSCYGYNCLLNNITPNIVTVNNCFVDAPDSVDNTVREGFIINWISQSTNYNNSNTDKDQSGQLIAIEKLDYRITATSPLYGLGYSGNIGTIVNSTVTQNLGGTILGDGFYEGLPFFDDIIANDPNFDIVNGELTNVGANDLEFLELPVIVGDIARTFGVIRKVGIIDYRGSVVGTILSATELDRLIEIRYTTEVNGILPVTYSKFRVGDRLSIDDMQRTNGDPNFDWSTAEDIEYFSYQLKIGIGKAGIITI